MTSAAPPVVTPVQFQTSNTMDSPDGNMTLTLVASGASYSLFISSKPDEQKVKIYEKEELSSHKLEIPYNTWSPDNKYVFLKESTPTLNNYYVFSTTGNPVSDNAQQVNIQELFSQKLPDYKITDVTGWAGPTLIIVNVSANKDGQNISFWFDVSNQSFTQLGTYFN